MTRLLVALFCLALTGLFCCPDMVRAEARSGALTLTPYAGDYQFDSDDPFRDRTVYGLGIGYNFDAALALETVFSFTEGKAKQGAASRDASLYAGRLDLLYRLNPGQPASFYLVGGFGLQLIDPEGQTSWSEDMETDAFVNYGLGLETFLRPDLALRLDARQFTVGENSHFDGDKRQHRTITAGLSFQYGGVVEPQLPPDSDGDGVSDGLDQCPDTPAGAQVNASGCIPDGDKDGVPDSRDRCPDTPSGVAVDASGCPRDSDGDGVTDERDRCPATPAGTEVDASGCPKPKVVDSDGDGVNDRLDRCPDTPPGTPVDRRGCPRDSDADGVIDPLDQCPDTPAGTAVNAEGCPALVAEEAPSRPVESLAEATQQVDVRFRTGESQVRPQFHEQMEQTANFIRANPGRKVRIEGHTDSVGSAASNRRLSQARAEKVRDYLIRNFGIDPASVVAVGYGEERPIADNTTQEGRRLNRRVLVTLEPVP